MKSQGLIYALRALYMIYNIAKAFDVWRQYDNYNNYIIYKYIIIIIIYTPQEVQKTSKQENKIYFIEKSDPKITATQLSLQCSY